MKAQNLPNRIAQLDNKTLPKEKNSSCSATLVVLFYRSINQNARSSD